MKIQNVLNLKNRIACILVILAETILLSGCASFGSAPASSVISIGMAKENVISIVGRGNVALAKKSTRTTAEGIKEVWILYKGPLGWDWTENAMDKQVILEFENGVITSITE